MSIQSTRLLLLLGVAAGCVNASPITWYLEGVKFNAVSTPGYSIGQFTYDADLNVVSNWTVTDIGTSRYFPDSWSSPAVYASDHQSPTVIMLSGLDGQGRGNFLQLVLAAPMTNAGGFIALAPYVESHGTENTWEGFQGSILGMGRRYLDEGFVSTDGPSTTPEPSTWACCIVALACGISRRKRYDGPLLAGGRAFRKAAMIKEGVGMKLGIGMLLFVAAAQAQTVADCNADVSSEDAKLTATAKMLVTNTGADVRVRVVTELTDATLDAWVLRMQRACLSWQAADNPKAAKNNLLVFAVAPNSRKSGIYYGDQWKPALDSQRPRISAEIMNRRFREGDWVGGLNAGMAEASRLIVQQSQVGAGSVVVNQAATAPVDLSGLWPVLLLAISALMIGFGLRTALRIRKERREEEQRTAGAQQAAVIAQQEATGLVAESSSWELGAESKKFLDSAVQTYSELGMGSTDPHRNGLSASQYGAMREKYREVADCIKQSRYGTGSSSAPSAAVLDEQIKNHLKNSAGIRRSRVVADVHHHYGPGNIFSSPVVVVPIENGSHHSCASPTTDSSPSYEPAAAGGSSDWGSSSSSSSGGSSDFGSSDAGCGGGSSDF